MKLGWSTTLLTVEGQPGVGQKVKSGYLLSGTTLSGRLSAVQIIVNILPISAFEKLSSTGKLPWTHRALCTSVENMPCLLDGL